MTCSLKFKPILKQKYGQGNNKKNKKEFAKAIMNRTRKSKKN